MHVDTDEDVVSAALRFAAKGIPVFPCRANKQPYTSRGFLDATVDEAQLRAWWQQWPGALIGMPTGRASGFLVVDLDRRHGYDGSDSWANLCEAHGAAPETVESLTPGGGIHKWFRMPDEAVRNSASKLGLGIDIRAEGGYVIVPPSTLPDGRRYEFEASSVRQAVDVPAWLLRLLGSTPGPQEVRDEPRPDGASIGSRNQYLASYAGRMAHAGFSRAQIRSAVLEENRRACDPPLSTEEIDRTVMKSASVWVMRAEGGPRAPESPEETQGLRWYQDAEWLEGLTAPDWLVPEHLERGSLAVTIGGWGSGKSLVEMDRALRIVHGMEWHGLSAKGQGCWVYVVGEAQRGFQRRVAAWHEHHQLEPNGRFIIIPEAVLVGAMESNIALQVALQDIQQRTGHAVLGVTLDTLARCWGLESENDNSDMSRWVTSVQRHIIEPTGALTSVLHHPGHADKGRGRGGSALPGAADTEWLIAKASTTVTMSCSKNKDGDLPMPKAWRVFGVNLQIGGVDVSVPCLEEESVVPRPVTQLAGKQAQCMAILRRLYDEHQERIDAAGGGIARVTRQEWREACEVKGVAGYRQSFNRLVEELEKKGVVTTDGYFAFLD